jgi:hypothetical protein
VAQPRSAAERRGPRGPERGRRVTAVAADCRCACGKLIARATPAGLELKCRGCKRVITVSSSPAGWRVLADGGDTVREIPIHPSGQRPSGAPSPTTPPQRG